MANLISAGTVEFGEDIAMMKKALSISETYREVVEFDYEYFTPKVVESEFVVFGDRTEYKLYKNGDCFSYYLDRLMTKTKYRSKGRIFQVYKLNGKPMFVNRLVMFYFGNHNYKTIDKMPHVSPIDKNTLNCELANLELVTQAEINKKYGMIPVCRKPAKIAPTKENIEDINDALEFAAYTQNDVAKVYNVSEMSIHRFLKRHKLRQFKTA